jgi:hypothetical protein
VHRTPHFASGDGGKGRASGGGATVPSTSVNLKDDRGVVWRRREVFLRRGSTGP